ncbi:hypothetical protein Csa_015368 [Cucumis sativus]|nr:hypothetical protein Csa_015368 [Cucumis sativus]
MPLFHFLYVFFESFREIHALFVGSKADVPRYRIDVGTLESPWVYTTVAGERKEPTPSLKSNASASVTWVCHRLRWKKLLKKLGRRKGRDVVRASPD